MDIVELVLRAGVVVKLVLFGLLALSALSWGVIVYKHLHLQRAKRESQAFMAAFDAGTPSAELAALAKTLPASPIAGVFLHLLDVESQLSPERLRGSLARALVHETQRLQEHLIVLATTGSSAPFIGLFGTVWGIVHAFQKIGETGSASLAVVAPGVAEALVTTAAGLAAAIPAVAAYNYQMALANELAEETEPVAAELLGMAGAEA